MATTSKLTKLQLISENERLRAHCNHIESKLAEYQVLSTKHQGTKHQGTKHSAPQPSVPSTKRADPNIVAIYRKADGSHWGKVRVGWNTYAHRQLMA